MSLKSGILVKPVVQVNRYPFTWEDLRARVVDLKQNTVLKTFPSITRITRRKVSAFKIVHTFATCPY